MRKKFGKLFFSKLVVAFVFSTIIFFGITQKIQALSCGTDTYNGKVTACYTISAGGVQIPLAAGYSCPFLSNCFYFPDTDVASGLTQCGQDYTQNGKTSQTFCSVGAQTKPTLQLPCPQAQGACYLGDPPKLICGTDFYGPWVTRCLTKGVSGSPSNLVSITGNDWTGCNFTQQCYAFPGTSKANQNCDGGTYTDAKGDTYDTFCSNGIRVENTAPLPCDNGYVCYEKSKTPNGTGNQALTKPPVADKPYSLCQQISNPTELTACQTCSGDVSQPPKALWTALGCIPTTYQGITSSVIKIGLSIAGGIALLMILAAALMLSTSQGEQKQYSEARELLTSAVMGLLFIIFSVTILQFVGQGIFKLPGF
jgi:hypothetical protein